MLPGGAAGRTDEALVGAFLAGEEAAFGELWRRYAPAAHAAVRRFARTPEDGADLVQRAFLRALEAARRRARLPFRGPFPFRPFILRVALNLARNHARDEARWRRAPLEAVDGEGLPAASSDGAPAEASLLRAERDGLVRAAVGGLPRRQREVLTLRVDAGLSFAEVGGALGISEGNARVSFHHAARRLRAALAPREDEP
ncbi:MAG TPA: sigma-70 family RNA polymerase sigma factor [Anaeromyxobacteraceae bacterium]|nr:sigma-70 family RNA polymerase sigma factor [Anaeromyxobacteraceae bacterium]